MMTFKNILGLVLGIVAFFILDVLFLPVRFLLDSSGHDFRVVIFFVPPLLSILSGFIAYLISGKNKIFGYITFGLTFAYVVYLWLPR